MVANRELSGQTREIFELLRGRLGRGSVTNQELKAKGFWHYSTRISEIRKWLRASAEFNGARIVCERGRGLTFYRLERAEDGKA